MRKLTLIPIILVTLAAAACGDSGASPSDTGVRSAASSTATASPTATVPLPQRTAPVDPPIIGLDAAAEAQREGRFEQAARSYAATAPTLDDDTARANAYLGAAVAWYEAGDAGQGIDALREAVSVAPPETQASRRARFLLGTRLAESGDHGEAAQVLEPLVQERYGDALQPRVDALFAAASARSGDRDAAEPAWDAALASAHTSGSLRASIYRERADAAQEAGDEEATRRWMGELVAASPGAEDRFALAELALKAGDSVAFETQLRAIIEDEAGSSYASRAIAALESEGYAVDPGDAAYVAYRRRQYPEARELFAQALGNAGLDAAERSWRLYYYAASHEDAGMLAEAIPIYDEAAAADPLSETAHRARYWAARSAERLGATADASARYTAVANTGTRGQYTSESAFRAGFVLYDEGNPAGAVAAWEATGAAHDARMLYWLGRAQRDLGNETAALAAFEAAATAGPMDFFGMEASRELGEPVDQFPDYEQLEAPSEPDWDAIASWLNGGTAVSAPVAAQTAATDLLALGLKREARQAIREADGGLARLRAAWELGLTDTVAREATALLQGADAAGAPKDIYRLAYPIAYVALLDNEARERGVDPLYLAALIRTESYWDPEAVSIADAIGLTQVIPSTGEAIANALSYDGWTPRDLTRPAVSIAFGAYYIGGQLERFGNPYQALAAYNGGPGNALIWGAAASPASPADFLEAITFTETRRYVEIVMSTYATYRYAYRD